MSLLHCNQYHTVASVIVRSKVDTAVLTQWTVQISIESPSGQCSCDRYPSVVTKGAHEGRAGPCVLASVCDAARGAFPVL